MPQVQEVLQRWNQAAESWEVEWKVPFHQDSKHPKLSSSLIAEFFTKKGSYNTVSCCVLFMYSLYIQVLLLNHLTEILKSALGNCACSTINSSRHWGGEQEKRLQPPSRRNAKDGMLQGQSFSCKNGTKRTSNFTCWFQRVWGSHKKLLTTRHSFSAATP